MNRKKADRNSVKKAKRIQMPAAVRNKICTTVALRGLSALRQWESMTIRHQWEWMNGFIHGKPNISPSQLSLISKGQAEYRDLYDEKKVIITRTDNTKRDASKLYLKPGLTRI